MLHTKFRGNSSNGSGEEDFWKVFNVYGHGSHLGHVTSNMSWNFNLPKSLHTKFGSKLPTDY